jgi:hypothetical protein
MIILTLCKWSESLTVLCQKVGLSSSIHVDRLVRPNEQMSRAKTRLSACSVPKRGKLACSERLSPLSTCGQPFGTMRPFALTNDTLSPIAPRLAQSSHTCSIFRIIKVSRSRGHSTIRVVVRGLVSKLFVIRCQLPLRAGKREQPSRGVYDARPLKRSGDWCSRINAELCVLWRELE